MKLMPQLPCLEQCHCLEHCASFYSNGWAQYLKWGLLGSLRCHEILIFVGLRNTTNQLCDAAKVSNNQYNQCNQAVAPCCCLKSMETNINTSPNLGTRGCNVKCFMSDSLLLSHLPEPVTQ